MMTVDTRILNRDTAVAIEKRAKELLPAGSVRLTSTDTYHRLTDGSYSDLYKRYAVEIRLANHATGNGETRVVDSTDMDVDEIVADMQCKLASAAKRTRKAIATEKSMDQE